MAELERNEAGFTLPELKGLEAEAHEILEKLAQAAMHFVEHEDIQSRDRMLNLIAYTTEHMHLADMLLSQLVPQAAVMAVRLRELGQL